MGVGPRELGWSLFLPVLKTVLPKFKTILPKLKPILLLKTFLSMSKTILLLKLKPVLLADLERTRLTDFLVQHRERVQWLRQAHSLSTTKSKSRTNIITVKVIQGM